MTVFGFDVDSYNKGGLSFAQAYAQGYRACYIKLGGNNLSGNNPYMMNGYHAQVNAAFAAGFTEVGNYWMVGGHDPARSGAFYRGNRDPRTTFDVIDNESIDYGNLWSSAECGVFLDVIQSPDPWHYANKSTGGWGSQGSWPELVARNVKGLVAYYNGSPFTNVGVNYPADRIKGHQYTSSATIGGLGLVDADAFTDDAFNQAKKQPPKGDDSVLVLISTPAPAASGNQFDWWVQNIDDKTYWHVENVAQLTYLRKIVTPNGTGMEVHENEPVDVLAGFTLIPQPAATVAIDAAAAAAIGAAIPRPSYKINGEAVPA